MILRRMPATITRVTDLSPTAREVELALPGPLDFLPGSFVNVFMTIDGQKMRRAYSISSDDGDQDRIALTIRRGSVGGMSERFWDLDIEDRPLEIMGPLGINTADKITKQRIFLFMFGIGVSVAKGIIEHLLKRTEVTSVTLVTGSRSEEEILYREYFEALARSDGRLQVRFVVSRPVDPHYPYRGHIQNHIQDLDFHNSTVYLCGTLAACQELKSAIENATDEQPEFLIEAFD